MSIFGYLRELVYFCKAVFISKLMIRVVSTLSIRSSRLKLFALLLPLSFSIDLRAQCAMCRAVVEQGGEEVAEGINSGIVYLMAFPYVVVAVAGFLLYRNWKRSQVAG